MAIVIGGLSALIAFMLVRLIALVTNLAFHQTVSVREAVPQGHHLGFWVVLVPVTGALIIGLMARFGSDRIRGHGIPEALEAILLGRSLVRLKVAILKPISAAVSIGTGGPFGAEGPIIMTGGAMGSLFAQRFKLSAAERKTLLVAGAAGGMAAVFATPIAAVMLAVELLLFEWKPRSFIPVAIAALVASIVRVPLLGAGSIFPVIPHGAPSGIELAIAAGIGILAGFGSSALTLIVYTFEDLFERLPIHWMWWPAIGAVFVGIGGIIEPRVLGVGYETIHGFLRGELLGPAVAGLLVAKAVVWAIALGSGTSGGVLAPLLMIGCALGALSGQLIPAGDPGLWAMIGMTGMMAGTMRAPLTAVLFAVELTRDYFMLPAVLVGAVAALGVTVLIMRRSILTEKLARRGHHIIREYSIDPFEITRVKEVMDPDIPLVQASMTLPEFSSRISSDKSVLGRRQGTLIVDADGSLRGIVTRGDLVRAMRQEGSAEMTVLDAGTTDLVVTCPDEPLHVALTKMLDKDIGRLPVVDPANRLRPVGYLGRAAILAARRKMHEEENFRDRPTAAGALHQT